MPFIRGRYHINAIAGEALEAAREAEAALLALDQDAEQAGSDAGAEGDDDAGTAEPGRGPIHRVEIEAAELVPAHSGRAQRGFVAHVHREGTTASGGRSSGAGNDAGGSANSNNGRGIASQQGQANGFGSLRSPRPGQLPSGGYAARPETHVFADHRDLVKFLRDEFAKQCER
ncbi:MAG: hypothetical protein WAN14_13330 [Candidatus Acidiferrales bacterium]